MSSKVIVLIAVCLLNVHLGSTASCYPPVTTPVTTPASCQPPVTTPACQVPVTYPPTTTPGCVEPVTFPPQVTLPPVITTTPGCVEPVTFPPVTFAPVTYPNVVATTPEPECVAPSTTAALVANLPDKVLVITNKGGYTAGMGVTYVDPLTNKPVTQTGSILSGQSYAFYIPGAVDYESEFGARLNVVAVGGKPVIENYKLTNNADLRQCIHVWGTTLYPAWSPIDC